MALFFLALLTPVLANVVIEMENKVNRRYTPEKIQSAVSFTSARYGAPSMRTLQFFDKSGDYTTVDLFNFNDLYYFGQVAIGSPSRSFSMLFDTGSPVTWVPSSKCKTDGCAPHTSYESTSGVVSQDKVDSHYGEGSISGVLAKDNATIGADYNGVGGFKFDMTFVAATSLDNYFSDVLFGGVFGLSQSALLPLVLSDPKKLTKTSLMQAFEQGAIKKQIVSFLLTNHKNDGSYGSTVAIGGYNTSYTDKEISWMPLVANDYWKVKSGEFKAGDTLLSKSSNVIFDTATTINLVPSKVYKAIHEKLGGTYNGTFYHVPCTGSTDLTIELGTKLVTIYYDTYVKPMGDGTCATLFQTDYLIEDTFIFGDSFLREFYSIFDLDAKRVGLAVPK